MAIDPMLYVEDLALMVCGHPDCPEDHSGQPLYMRSQCHPRAGTLAVFEPGHDHLHLVCAVCERGIATVAIAHRPAEARP
jgi:hypothetical protein